MPLHPVVVHFPIVLSVIVLVLSLIFIISFYRYGFRRSFWIILVSMQFGMLASSVVSVKLGEKDEERVENSANESVLHDHEEWGEKIPIVAFVAMVLSLLPFFLKKRSILLVSLYCLLACVQLAFVFKAGHTGGRLVYEGGAACVYQTSGSQNTSWMDEE